MYRSLLMLVSMLVFSTGICFAQQTDLLPHEHTPECQLTSAEPVQIVCILDRSGSMRHLVGDTIGGYNSFLDKQRQEKGSAEVTTVLFDDKYPAASIQYSAASIQLCVAYPLLDTGCWILNT